MFPANCLLSKTLVWKKKKSSLKVLIHYWTFVEKNSSSIFSTNSWSSLLSLDDTHTDTHVYGRKRSLNIFAYNWYPNYAHVVQYLYIFYNCFRFLSMSMKPALDAFSLHLCSLSVVAAHRRPLWKQLWWLHVTETMHPSPSWAERSLCVRSSEQGRPPWVLQQRQVQSQTSHCLWLTK